MFNVVLYGFKGVGKTALGERLAELLDCPFVDTDAEIEQLHAERTGEKLSFRRIYQQHGEDYFRQLESRAVQNCAGRRGLVIAIGGSAFRDPDNRRALRPHGVFAFLSAPPRVLADRIEGDVPPFLDADNLAESVRERNAPYRDLYRAHADIILDAAEGTPQELAQKLEAELEAWCDTMMRSPNTFGQMVRMTTFGESHGKGVGVVIDGAPAGIEFDVDRIQMELNRRRPGQSAVTTPRSEQDRVHVMSGVFEGKTLGTPICMIIYNEEKDPSAYAALRDVFRPGHADFTYFRKYGLRDYRGGGRSSGRETAARVAAGALAMREVEKRGLRITGHALEIAGIRAESFEPDQIERNAVRCADAKAAGRMEQAIKRAREEDDSVGGIAEVRVSGMPAGLGEPVFYKLEAVLAHAVMSLGAVKGFEIGSGFAVAGMRGSESNDQIREEGFLSNHAGGVLGGISTGQDLLFRFAVKPPASIGRRQRTVNRSGRDTVVRIEGRHDPCIVPRIVPVAESITAWVLWNAVLWQENLAEQGASAEE